MLENLDVFNLVLLSFSENDSKYNLLNVTRQKTNAASNKILKMYKK